MITAIPDYRWWLADDADETAHRVQQVVAELWTRSTVLQQLDLRHARLYGNLPVLGLTANSYSRVNPPGVAQSGNAPAVDVGLPPRLSLNIVKNACNSVQSKVGKTKPRPMFLTSGGDWSEQRKAKNLTAFCDGAFYETKLYELAPKILLDAIVFGTGAVKVFSDDDEQTLKVERVMPGELIVDEVDAFYGAPRCLYQRKFIDKGILLELYPDHAERIDSAGTGPKDYSTAHPWFGPTTTRQVEVIEAWHLPSQPGAGDGKHVIAITNCVLLEEEWARDTFPFVFLKWTERLMGFWGCGLAEELTNLQLEINKTLQKIARCLDLMATPKVFVENGSKIVKHHLSNEIGAIINYTGTPPQYVVHPAVPPELLAYLENLVRKAYEIAGVSQLSAQSQKPAGLDSGAALRQFDDIESERFLTFSRQYEQFFLDCAAQLIELARTLPKYEVRVPGKRSARRVKWSDVDLDADAYVMQCFPTNALANTPAARLAQVQDLLNAGLISPDEAKSLLDFPDLQAMNSVATASTELVEEMVDRMLDDGIYEPPEPAMNLPLTLRLVQGYYLRARTDGAPEDRLGLLLDFMEETRALMAQAAPQQPAPPGAMPPPGPPPPMPAEPPPPDMQPGMAA